MIRRLVEKDLKDLLDISRKTFDETFRPDNKDEDIDEYLKRNFTEERMRNELSNPHSEFYGLYGDGILKGYLKLKFMDAQSEPHDDVSMDIERIYMLKEYHGDGSGKMLMELALKRAAEMDMKKVWLGVWEKNDRALSFYRKSGFRHTGSHVFMMGDDRQTDLILELSL